MVPENDEDFLDERLRQIREGACEAIRREVEWLERHNFPVWISDDGRVVDANKSDSAKPPNK